MRFTADECCGALLVENLRAVGQDVLYIAEENPGVTDKEVLSKSFTENRILITEDKDFGELVYRLKKEAVGIILLRFSPAEAELKWQRLEEAIIRNDITLTGNFIVIDAEKFRVRSLQ